VVGDFPRDRRHIRLEPKLIVRTSTAAPAT
jgi:hypothetical protein